MGVVVGTAGRTEGGPGDKITVASKKECYGADIRSDTRCWAMGIQ
jgi:hypothetical protein